MIEKSQRIYLREAVRRFARAFAGRGGNSLADARQSAFLAIRNDISMGCSVYTAVFELERYIARNS